MVLIHTSTKNVRECLFLHIYISSHSSFLIFVNLITTECISLLISEKLRCINKFEKKPKSITKRTEQIADKGDKTESQEIINLNKGRKKGKATKKQVKQKRNSNMRQI